MSSWVAHAPVPRARLLRRLTSVRNLEGINIGLFWILYALAWSDATYPTAWGFRTYGLALVNLVLAVDSFYRHLKLCSVRKKRPLPHGFRKAFTRFRALDLVLRAASPVRGACRCVRSQ